MSVTNNTGNPGALCGCNQPGCNSTAETCPTYQPPPPINQPQQIVLPAPTIGGIRTEEPGKGIDELTYAIWAELEWDNLLREFKNSLQERQEKRVEDGDMDWLLDSEVYFDRQQVEACLMDQRE